MNNEQQNSQLLSEFLDCLFYGQADSKLYTWGASEWKYTRQEINLILRPSCDQQCEYCYLYKHGHELYPHVGTKEEIVKNVELIVDYIYNQKKIFPYNFHLFGGDITSDGLLLDVLKVFEKQFDKMKLTSPSLFTGGEDLVKKESVVFHIPSNLSFVEKHPNQAKALIKCVKRFKEKFNIYINFSWSTDGFYASETREKKPLTQEHFDKFLDFCVETGTGFHPMIAPENIEHWIQNYDWWLEMQEKLNNATGYQGDFQPMMLEVRNDGWTPEKIQEYLKLLDHVMEVRFKKCGEDKDKLAYHLFNGRLSNDKNPLYMKQYDLLPLYWMDPNDRYVEKPGCSLFNCISINCNDLGIVLCHRLSYQHLTAGYFCTDSTRSHINGIKAINASAYVNVKNLKQKFLPICEACPIAPVCLKGCFGAQFEHYGELLMPITSVCDLFKAKVEHLIDLYEQYDVIEIALREHYIDNKGFEKWIVDRHEEWKRNHNER